MGVFGLFSKSKKSKGKGKAVLKPVKVSKAAKKKAKTCEFC